MSRYVLDSYAVLAWHNQETHAQRVRQLVRNVDNRFWMSIINVGEVYYRIAKDYGLVQAEETLTWVNRHPISFVDANQRLTMDAARIKSAYNLSYADCFAAALARRMRAQVVTGDREFLALERDNVVELAWLG